MFKDIQVTLYDIFAYLLPGSIFLSAVLVLFWVIFLPATALPVRTLSVSAWSGLVLVSYLLGHVNQAIANIVVGPHGFERWSVPKVEVVALGEGKEALPRLLVERARMEVGKDFGEATVELPAKWLYVICDETLVQSGITIEREIFQYREGFYRGLMVSQALLALAVLIRLAVSPVAIEYRDHPVAITRWMLLYVCGWLLLGAMLSYRRYRHFGMLRVTRAVVDYLVLKVKGAKGEGGK